MMMIMKIMINSILINKLPVYRHFLINLLTFTWPHLNSDVGLEEGEY